MEHSYQPGTFQCTSSCNNRLRCRWVRSTTTQITSCLRSDGQHAPRTQIQCRPCGIHAHDTEVRAHTCLHGLFSVANTYQPGTFQCTSSCNNTLRCRWIPSKNDEITSCLRSDGNTRPVRANTADRAPFTPVTQGYVRILVCTVCFQWNIHTTISMVVPSTINEALPVSNVCPAIALTVIVE